MLREAGRNDPGWLRRAGGPLALPPLMAVTHSCLLRLPEFTEHLHACARWLLDAGADPLQTIGNRWPPASLQSPSDTERLSALYGAAGQNHDAQLTQMLLQAGANPNDGESLYHATESRDLRCMTLLLEAGATVEGSNAFHHQLDTDDIARLRLLLAHTVDVNDSSSGLGNPRSGRFVAAVRVLTSTRCLTLARIRGPERKRV